MPEVVASQVLAATAYQFQPAHGADFETATVWETESAANSAAPTAAEVAATAYQWRARAEQDGAWGPWSHAAVLAMRSGITGMSPAGGEEVRNATPTLQWDDVPGAVGYRIQAAASAAGVGSAPVASVSESEYAYPAALEYGESLFWRVQAVDSRSQSGPWSGTLSLTRAGVTQFTIATLSEKLVKDTSHPILGPRDGYWDLRVSSPTVIYDGAKYHMWYNNADTPGQIGHITSTDGVSWVNASSSVDGLHATDTRSWQQVVAEPGGFRMFYLCWMSHLTDYYYRTATSVDGDTWTDDVIALRHNDGTEWRTGLAYSTDGVSWTPDSDNPVDLRGPSDAWDGDGMTISSVLFVDGFRIYYGGSDGGTGRVGTATLE